MTYRTLRTEERMARPMRKDADYFPFICKEGKTFSILRNRYPLEGIGFFTELCIILTTTPDHHIQLKTDLDFEYLCSKMKCDKSKAESIIDLLVMTGKMHKELWEKANVILIPDLLDSLNDAYERRANEIITIKELINVYINPLNDNINPESVPQKPLKDSKVNKSKVNNNNDFDLFWSAYPKKVAKAEAIKSYNKKLKALPDINKHIEIIKNWCNTEQWKNNFIPNPTTWLNQERWNDEIILSADEKKKKDRDDIVQKIIKGEWEG